jgi:hypothetical protein
MLFFVWVRKDFFSGPEMPCRIVLAVIVFSKVELYTVSCEICLLQLLGRPVNLFHYLLLNF